MGNRRVDIAGQRFGGIVAIRDVGTNGGATIKWEFSCDCGRSFIGCGSKARLGEITSCPECSRSRAARLITTHGMRDTAEYNIWNHIKSRCLNNNSASFERYGARGITVCQEWIDSFEAFLKDMGPRPSINHSIDRIDNSGNYEPANCRWATSLEQGNNKRNNINIEINGHTKTLSSWCKEFGACVQSAWSRYKKGMRGMDVFQTTEKRITAFGITDTIRGWSERTGINRTTLSMRVNRYGWPIEIAVTKGATK